MQKDWRWWLRRCFYAPTRPRSDASLSGRERIERNSQRRKAGCRGPKSLHLAQLLVQILGGLAFPGFAVAGLSPSQSEAMVLIEVPLQGGTVSNVGSGFVVKGNSPRHYVVTASHALINRPASTPITQCVELPPGIKLTLGNEGGYPLVAKCVHHLSDDVSLIELAPRAAIAPYPTLTLNAKQIEASEVYSLAAFSVVKQLDTTRVATVTNSTGPSRTLMVTVLSGAGMSGGPYTRADGSVVAIHHSQASFAPGSAFIIPIAALRIQLENLMPPIASEGAEVGVLRELRDTGEPLGLMSAAMALQDVPDPELRIRIFRKLFPDTGAVGPEWDELLRRFPSRPGRADAAAIPALQESDPILRAKIARRAAEKRRTCLTAGLTIDNGLLYCNGEDLFLPSPNYQPGNEPKLVMLHSNGIDSAETAINLLSSTQINASVHVLVDRDGTFVQMVNFRDSAWHTGKGIWAGSTNLNRQSIGIQLINWGRLQKAEDGRYLTDSGREISVDEVRQIGNEYWQSFTSQQMQTLQLVLALIAKNYPIKDIIGHCEASPGRRSDPGPLLPVTQLEAITLGSMQRAYQCATPQTVVVNPK